MTTFWLPMCQEMCWVPGRRWAEGEQDVPLTSSSSQLQHGGLLRNRRCRAKLTSQNGKANPVQLIAKPGTSRLKNFQHRNTQLHPKNLNFPSCIIGIWPAWWAFFLSSIKLPGPYLKWQIIRCNMGLHWIIADHLTPKSLNLSRWMEGP